MMRGVMLISVGMLLTAPAACERDADGAAVDARGEEAPAPDALATAPIAYFNNQCARCHGEDGVFAGVAYVTEPADDAELIHEIEEMVAGPARETISGGSLDALVAFHRALLAGEPFVAVTRIGSNIVAGEVSKGARVRVHFGETHVDPIINERSWEAKAPNGFDAAARRSEVRVEAMREKTTVTIRLDETVYSHDEPLSSDEESDQGSGVDQ